jgi:hypothetical protein
LKKARINHKNRSRITQKISKILGREFCCYVILRLKDRFSLATQEGGLYHFIFAKVYSVTRNDKVQSIRFTVAITVLAAIAMLAPHPAFVLCVAPGGHIGIEALGSDCCGTADISSSSGRQYEQDEEFSKADNCVDCTDYFIAPTSQGVAPKTGCGSPENPPAAVAFKGSLPTFSVLPSLIIVASDNSSTFTPLSLNLPLRC